MIANRFKHLIFTYLQRVFIITALLFLCVGGSAYAACIVDWTSYDTISTPLTPSSKITAANIKDWDTSGDDVTTCDVTGITNMSSLFEDLAQRNFNQDISAWDVSNVTNMNYMFGSTAAFNQDISSWDVSNVTSMKGMFYRAPVLPRGRVGIMPDNQF